MITLYDLLKRVKGDIDIRLLTYVDPWGTERILLRIYEDPYKVEKLIAIRIAGGQTVTEDCRLTTLKYYQVISVRLRPRTSFRQVKSAVQLLVNKNLQKDYQLGL